MIVIVAQSSFRLWSKKPMAVHYHTQVGDLDYGKSLDDSGNILHVMHNNNLPENIVSTIRKIRDAKGFVDDIGVDAAMKEFLKIKSELQPDL